MMLTACVRNKSTNRLEVISSEYDTKKKFERDLRDNGYSIRFISTEESYDSDCEKWEYNNEKVKLIEKLKYASDKAMATKLDMTVSQFRKMMR